jgi:hypothetical protein
MFTPHKKKNIFTRQNYLHSRTNQPTILNKGQSLQKPETYLEENKTFGETFRKKILDFFPKIKTGSLSKQLSDHVFNIFLQTPR